MLYWNAAIMIIKDTTASNNLNTGIERFYSKFDESCIIFRVGADKAQEMSGKYVGGFLNKALAFGNSAR